MAEFGVKVGDRIEIEVTNDTGTVEPKVMYETGRTRESAPKGACSFCFKGSEEVKRIISGPEGINICNECVELSQQILSEK